MAGPAMLAERRQAVELMDDPSLDTDTYQALIADLARVNRLTRAYRPTLAFLDRTLAERSSFSLLDVGFGHGDMLREIARWAAMRGKRAKLVGIDLNPSSLAAARSATDPALPITFLTGDYRKLGEGFDLIVSSLVAHHMSYDQLVAFLRHMESEARLGWFVNDLHRHGMSYLGYPLLARLMGWHPIVRLDGQTSIARSFRPADWVALFQEAEITCAEVTRWFPFRLCVSKIR